MKKVSLKFIVDQLGELGWDAHINPKVDFDLHKNEDRIFKYK